MTHKLLPMQPYLRHKSHVASRVFVETFSLEQIDSSQAMAEPLYF